MKKTKYGCGYHLIHVQVLQICHILETLRERLHTHILFTKDQSFYLNYHKFSIKSYVLDVH